MKGKEVKKQHYVPRCYLERWKNNNNRIMVYDKKMKMIRPNKVSNVACERYFYDFDYHELSQPQIEWLKENGIDPEKDSQFLEHFFCSHVEGRFAELLSKIIDKTKDITPWYEKNCFFVSKSEKRYLSLGIAYQYIRTNEKRRMIIEDADCIEQMLRDISDDEQLINNYTLKSGDEEIIHGSMMLNTENIEEMASSFYDLTWILGINRTDMTFYTSDNPVGTRPHVKHPILSMGGIRSKGVEVFFPLSPDIILIMFDGSYHHKIAPYDRRYVSLTETEIIEDYNILCAYTSNRCVFSSDGKFEVIEKILKKDEDAFERPKTRLSYGGKPYFPKV